MYSSHARWHYRNNTKIQDFDSQGWSPNRHFQPPPPSESVTAEKQPDDVTDATSDRVVGDRNGGSSSVEGSFAVHYAEGRYVLGRV